ncbi:DASS family sodium-coupled anion symporter [Planctomycetota bacterium]|nr:DASS family sodium-coupled anion symporter [Planctomycetota bacterium]
MPTLEDKPSTGLGGSRTKQAGLALGPILFVLALLIPMPEVGGVSASEGVRVTLGLAAWMAVWWTTEAVPLAATSLLPLVLLPVSGVASGSSVAPKYFSDIIALFLGGFCLALAMQKSGLHKRIALRVLRITGTNPRRVVLGFVVSSALLSMWVSNTATTLMLMPVAATVFAVALPSEARTETSIRFSVACLLAVAFGANLGGLATTIGTPPNAFFQGYFNQRYAAEIAAGTVPEITFGRWMVIGLPLVMVLVPACWVLLTRVSPGVPKIVPQLSKDSLLQLKSDAKPSAAEWLVIVIFVGTATAWVTHAPIRIGEFVVPLTGWDEWLKFGSTSSFVTDGTIAIAASLLLFVLPDSRKKNERLLTWEFAESRLPWGALLLFGGGLSLAFAFEVGGLSEYLEAAFGTLGGVPVWLLLILVIILVTLFSEFASNTAAVAMVVPVLASLADGLGLEPAPLLIAAALGGSCGYALPVATPPNTIVYATGNVSVSRMIRAGALLDIVAVATMYTVVMLVVQHIF